MRDLFKTLTVSALLICSSVHAKPLIIQGNQGIKDVRLKELPQDTQVDLSGAFFSVSNSKNESPTRFQSCKKGAQKTNRYPIAIESSPSVLVVGGRFNGKVPLNSDWVWTYCNSAALRVEQSPHARLVGQRMRRVWDAIRIQDGSDGFLIDQVWLTDVRDDCLENDYLMAGQVRDSLLDGCFAGLSFAPGEKLKRRPTIVVDRVLMRLESYNYRGEARHALPFKMKYRSVNLRVRNSILAFESSNLVGGKYLGQMWKSVQSCDNNKILWLGDGKPPPALRTAPSCFSLESGEQARKTWSRAKQNWINCHKAIHRFQGDPRSRPGIC